MNEQKIVGFSLKYKASSEEGIIQNLCVLQRLINIVKVRKDDIFVAFGDMEKVYYERVNMKKLFEVIQDYIARRQE